MKVLKNILFYFLLFISFETTSQNFDIDLLRDINLNRNKNLDNTFRIFTNSAAPTSIGLPILMYGIGQFSKDSVLLQKSVLVGLSVAMAVSISTMLKYGINRPRPFVKYPDIDKQTSAGSPSFPSGHTSDAFSLATSLSLAYPKWYIIVPAYIWAGTVAYSRMDLGVHYPSDVLAGILIGSGSAFVCFKIQQLMLKKNKTRKPVMKNFGF